MLVGAIVFVDTMFFAALTPLLPHYADELGLGKAGAGLLQAAYPAGCLLGAIPSGIVAARLGVKPTVVSGLLGLAVTSVLFGLAGEAWQLDAARFAQGIASSFTWTGALAWLVAAAPPGRRGRLIGTAFGVAIGGALFGPVLGGIASVVGAAPAFSAVAVIALALALWASRTEAAAPEDPQPVSTLFAALRARRIRIAVWFVVLPALMFGTLSTLAPLRLSHLGFGSLVIGAIWLVSAGFEATLSPALGHLSDRVGRIKPIKAGLAASTVVLLVLPWPDNRLVLAAVVVCAGLSFGAFWPPAMSLLSDSAEQRGLDYGYAFALVNLAWAPGQALGAAGSGGLAALTGDAVPYLVLAVLCAATLAALSRPRRASAA
jgi:MFS family permease